jgi:hypothetical protein
VVISPPPSFSAPVERLQGNESSSQCKNFLKIAPTFMENLDKIVLTEKQIEQFDRLGQQVICGSITIDEAVLELLGGGAIDVAVVFAFFIFVNWLD